jgi:hypothetical protein
MPNPSNIGAPITLIAHGRSGTSVIHKLFEQHPDVDSLGETADLVLGVWYSLGVSEDIVRGQFDSSGRMVNYELRSVEAFRAMYMAMFPSEKKYWMQKPIGASFVRDAGRFWGHEAEFIAWYWDSMATLFPQGKFMTILRNPCDVVLSSADYWGMSQSDAWKSVGLMARVLSHPKSLATHAISFDELVRDPKTEIQKLCDAAGVTFDSCMIKATEFVHVPKMGTFVQSQELEKERVVRKFSRQEQWSELDCTAIDEAAIESLRILWEKYRAPLELPSSIR